MRGENLLLTGTSDKDGDEQMNGPLNMEGGFAMETPGTKRKSAEDHDSSTENEPKRRGVSLATPHGPGKGKGGAGSGKGRQAASAVALASESSPGMGDKGGGGGGGSHLGQELFCQMCDQSSGKVAWAQKGRTSGGLRVPVGPGCYRCFECKELALGGGWCYIVI